MIYLKIITWKNILIEFLLYAMKKLEIHLSSFGTVKRNLLTNDRGG